MPRCRLPRSDPGSGPNNDGTPPAPGSHTGRVSVPDPDETSSSTAAHQDGQAHPRESLWRNRDFKVLLAGQGVSGLGDVVSLTAVPLLVLYLTGSGLLMGVVGVLQSLPDLLFGLPVGALADRWDRRRMMLFADLGRALLTALIPLSLVVGLPTIAVVLAVTFPINVMRVFFAAAYTASVPSLVGRDEIGPANSYFEAVFSLGWIVGPAIAGVLTSLIGPGPTLAVDAASFAVSALSLSLVRRRLQARKRPADSHLLHDIRDGIAFLARHRTLRAAVAFLAGVNLLTAPLIPVLTYYITVDRGLSATSFGLAISAFGFGYFIGALVAARLTKRGRVGWLMLAGSALAGAMIALVALSAALPAILAISFVAGVAESLFFISYMTLRASVTPDELLGRIGTTTRTITLGIQPLGMLAGGILLDRLHGTATLVLMGGLLIAVATTAALSGALRTARATQGVAPATA